MTVIQAADKGKHLVAWQNNPYGHPAIIEEDTLYGPILLEIYRQKRNPSIIPDWKGKIRRIQYLMNYQQRIFFPQSQQTKGGTLEALRQIHFFNDFKPKAK